jgi:hypothetical protein
MVAIVNILLVPGVIYSHKSLLDAVKCSWGDSEALLEALGWFCGDRGTRVLKPDKAFVCGEFSHVFVFALASGLLASIDGALPTDGYSLLHDVAIVDPTRDVDREVIGLVDQWRQLRQDLDASTS